MKFESRGRVQVAGTGKSLADFSRAAIERMQESDAAEARASLGKLQAHARLLLVAPGELRRRNKWIRGEKASGRK